MTAKLLSIRTRSGDDLTQATTLRPVQTISQRQAIQRICSRADPPIWPVVAKRHIESAEESDRDNRPWRLLSLFAFAASAAAVLYLAMWLFEKLFR
ncbi:MAG: hypothetical protein KDI73_13525 [Candidatus Competibacteraceae bacterium]|nr:hypothetical protein [Candidatus Competibacteraceae bacterium]